MTASSDQKRKIPLTALRTIARAAMKTAAPRVPAARTFSTPVSTLLKRVMRPPEGTVGRPGLPGRPNVGDYICPRLLLLAEELSDEVLSDEALVLHPDARDHCILESLALGGGGHEDLGASRLHDLGLRSEVDLKRDLAVVDAGLVGGVLHDLLQVGRQRREPLAVHHEHIAEVAVVGLCQVALNGVHLLRGGVGVRVLLAADDALLQR